MYGSEGRESEEEVSSRQEIALKKHVLFSDEIYAIGLAKTTVTFSGTCFLVRAGLTSEKKDVLKIEILS